MLMIVRSTISISMVMTMYKRKYKPLPVVRDGESKTVSIRVPAVLLAPWKTAAARQGMTATTFLLSLLVEALKKEGTEV